MPGARYDGDLIIQFRGNKDLARQYVPEARKVMGFVLQDAEVNGLGVHMVKRYTADGTEIIAEKIGDLKRVRITPPGGPGRNKPVRIFEDLVVGYIDQTVGTGSVNVPPVILSPQEEDALEWRTFFYNDEAPGFYEGAGSYADVFPRADDLDRRPHLPSANTQWYDADGFYCAWLSAVTHVTPVGRHPENLYGVRVVALGRNVIDLRTYAFATTSYNNAKVLSACIRQKWLYMVVSPLGQLTYTPRPAVGIGGDAWASEKFAFDEFEYALIRVPLIEVTDPVTGTLHYDAVDEADEVLWSGGLERAYGPWRFSTDGRRCATVQLPPGNSFLIYKAELLTDSPDSGSSLYELLISDDGSSASMGASGAGNVIYDDGDAQLELEHVGTGAFDYVCGSLRFPAIRSISTTLTARRIAHADPRNGRFFMHERDFRDPVVDPTDPSYVYHKVTERDIVLEDGTETYIYENTDLRIGGRRPDPTVVENYVIFGYSIVFSDLSVGGIAGFYAGAVGVTDIVLYAETFPWPGFLYADMPFLDPTLIAVSYFYSSDFGVANGGMAFSRHRVVDPPVDPVWNQSLGYGFNFSIAPEYAAQPSVLVHTAGTSNGRYMLAQSNARFYFAMTEWHYRWDVRPSYLTGADLNALMGLDVENDASIIDSYILGKPLKAQKYNLPVQTP